MITTSKIEKIKLLLDELVALENQEKSIFFMATKAAEGDCKSFNVLLTPNTIHAKKNKSLGVDFPMPSIFKLMMSNDPELVGVFSPADDKKDQNNQDVKLEIGDAEILNFLALAMTIIAGRKKKVLTALRRTGVKI